MHVQLVREQAPSPVLEGGLLQAVPAAVRPGRLVLGPSAAFPFGMGLDYEGKLSYYLPGEANENRDPLCHRDRVAHDPVPVESA
jgi:hypothetical protein